MLTPEVGFKFRENAQHVQESFPCRAACVDRLFCRFESDALLLQRIHDVLKILDAARKAVDPCDDKRISAPQEIQQNLKLGPAGPTCSARFLGPDHLAAGSA